MARKKGSKLARTEIFNIRFDPKLKMAAELLAGRERRTMSSMIEAVMDRAVKESPITADSQGQPVTAWEVAEKCWHVNPILRLDKLSTFAPELMTIDERSQWTCIGYLLAVEREVGGREPRYGQYIDFEWLPALMVVWPMIVEQSSRPDMDWWPGLRAAYLAARPA